jgi:hypothetical protein
LAGVDRRLSSIYRDRTALTGVDRRQVIPWLVPEDHQGPVRVLPGQRSAFERKTSLDTIWTTRATATLASLARPIPVAQWLHSLGALLSRIMAVPNHGAIRSKGTITYFWGSQSVPKPSHANELRRYYA